MAFMDKKEQVLTLELTPYGRYLYSIGRLKPSHYEFYDDDIVYDKRYLAGRHRQEKFKELQNEVIPRIKNTPTNQLQTVFSTVDNGDLFASELALDQMHCKDDVVNSSQITKVSQLLNDSEYSMGLPLGSAENGNKKAPAWEVNLLKGKVSNFNVFLQAPSNRPPSQFRIPQLDVDIDIELYTYKNSQGNNVTRIVPDMLIAEIDEKNATDGIENEYELEIYYSREFALDGDALLEFPTPATTTIILSGTYEGAGLTSMPDIDLYQTSKKAVSKMPLEEKAKPKPIPLSGSLLTREVFNSINAGATPKETLPTDLKSSYISLMTSEGFEEKYYIISNLVGSNLMHNGISINFNACEDREPNDPCAEGFGYSSVLDGYYFFEGADIIDATRNLANAINASQTKTIRNFHASSSVSFTGTDGASTWIATTGTVTIETMRVGLTHFGLATPRNAVSQLENTHGISINTDKPLAFFEGGADPTRNVGFEPKQKKIINEHFSNVRRGIPGFVHMGDRENLFKQNLLAYRDKMPFLFKNEDHNVQKFYFSDKPEAEKSDKFINYYFDVATDADIDRDDFCEARIFDPEKSLYVKGYIDCVKPELQSVDIYDQTDEDFGEPC